MGMDEILIGFNMTDDDADDEISSEEALMGSKAEFTREKVYEKEDVYVPESYMKKIDKSYEYVVVNDFGDDYHLTEEEKREKNKYYEAFKPLIKSRKTYRKLNDYIDVTRSAIKCLKLIADTNEVMSPDKFIKDYFNGKISIDGLFFPKYKGKDRKDLSWRFVAEIIMHGGDASDIYVDEDDNLFGPDDVNTNIISEERLNYIFAEDEYDELLVETLDPDDPEIENLPVAVELSMSEMKKLVKSDDCVLKVAKKIKNKFERIDAIKGNISDMTFDDLEHIERYDIEHGYTTDTQMPEFNGDIMDDDAYEDYMDALEAYEYNNVRKYYHGKMRTQAEIDEIEVKDLLDREGYNIRAMYGNKYKENKSKSSIKRDAKRIKQTKERLIECHNRRSGRKTLSSFINDNNYNDKKKKKKDKVDKSHKKKYKDDVDNTFENIMMGAMAKSDSYTWDDYEEDSTNWSWPESMK